MKLEIMLQDSEREGKKEGIKIGRHEDAVEKLQRTANVMRQLSSYDDVFKTLKKIYHNDFSDEEIHKLMNETK